MDIEGQTAIVSGGASGLGRATAKALVEAGVRVAILDVNEAAAAAAAREIGGFAIGCDVTEAASVEAAFVTAREPKRLVVLKGGHMEVYGNQAETALVKAIEWFSMHLKS